LCYDFHFRISYEEEDVMSAKELNMFSIGTIVVPIHIELVFKSTFIPYFSITKPVPKQPIELICGLAINLTIPPNIIKQRLLETFFHLEVGEMIINKTPT
jgi:hypothetical protein